MTKKLLRGTDMARRQQPPIEERRQGWLGILHRRQMNRLGLDLRTLPDDKHAKLWEEFLKDMNRVNSKTLKHSEVWSRFDARLDDMLGPAIITKLLQRKKRQTG